MVYVATDFESLFRAEFPRLVSLGVAMCGRRDVASELAQETMLRAHRRWSDVGQLEEPGAWCRKVMVNLLIDQHRTAVSERSAIVRLRGWRHHETTSQGTDGWSALVANLSPRQRAVVTLHYAEDLSVEKIAETLGVSVGTVKATLFKARQTIARRLRDEGRGAGDEEVLHG